ncbi:MAG: dipeptide epimerase [Saprospiraceae bacterium]|nr:dipeptide epimerase [Saprospiraceae bacterium]
MQLLLHPVDLQLRHTFTISRESRDVQPSLIIELREGMHAGFGEATANTYYKVTVEGMQQRLEDLRSKIEGYTLQSAEDFWEVMQEDLHDHPFLQCALDEAAHDLVARKAGMPLYKYWGLELIQLPTSNYTIGIDTIEKMVAKMKEQPWPIYKIKLGTEDDLAIIKELRKHTDALFRVDANCAWTAQQTIDLAPELREQGVEFIEQPLPAEEWRAMKEVYQKSVLPVVADESCRIESDVAKCHQHFHVVNIKLTKCGGLTPARRMIAQANQLGMKTMVGCMTESSVGISAIGHLLPLLDYVDMDGALLLANDPADGVRLKDGQAIFPDRNGTGVRLK